MKKWISSLLNSLRQIVWKWFFRTALVLIFVAGALAGILYLGNATEQDLTGESRYQFTFHAIQCDPPPGMTRTEFLDEAQYLANAPENWQMLEKAIPSKLADTFSVHPWVKKVQRVKIEPPKTVLVHLIYRRPVLVVKWNGGTRVVDAEAVLLPTSAPTDGLSVFTGTPAPPNGAAGTVWEDPAIIEAAKTAAQKMSASNNN